MDVFLLKIELCKRIHFEEYNFCSGVAMLFSAGTFLYVATVHVLPEVTNLGHGHGAGSGDSGGGFSKSEMIVLIVGAIMPLFLTMGHHH